MYDPGVLCLLTASMQLWQTSLLACRKDKISDLLQILDSFWLREWNDVRNKALEEKKIRTSVDQNAKYDVVG